MGLYPPPFLFLSGNRLNSNTTTFESTAGTEETSPLAKHPAAAIRAGGRILIGTVFYLSHSGRVRHAEIFNRSQACQIATIRDTKNALFLIANRFTHNLSP
jgi:hypothetical protein